MVDESRLIWSYPKYERSQESQATQSRIGRISLNTEEDKDNAFEFNDLETDERINIDVS
jgi:hypothetical protein